MDTTGRRGGRRLSREKVGLALLGLCLALLLAGEVSLRAVDPQLAVSLWFETRGASYNDFDDPLQPCGCLMKTMDRYTDPWGRPWHFERVPTDTPLERRYVFGVHTGDAYFLPYSAGPDGRHGGGDDLYPHTTHSQWTDPWAKRHWLLGLLAVLVAWWLGTARWLPAPRSPRRWVEGLRILWIASVPAAASCYATSWWLGRYGADLATGISDLLLVPPVVALGGTAVLGWTLAAAAARLRRPVEVEQGPAANG